jgi:hypothetical protein
LGSIPTSSWHWSMMIKSQYPVHFFPSRWIPWFIDLHVYPSARSWSFGVSCEDGCQVETRRNFSDLQLFLLSDTVLSSMHLSSQKNIWQILLHVEPRCWQQNKRRSRNNLQKIRSTVPDWHAVRNL